MVKVGLLIRSLAARILVAVGLVNGTIVALFIGFIARSHDPQQEFSSDFGHLLLLMFSWFVPFAVPFLVIAIIVEVTVRLRARRERKPIVRASTEPKVPRETDLKFGTLGGADSNHALVLKRYLTARGVAHTDVSYFLDFDEAFDALARGDIDFVLQVSVHPSHTACVARYVGRAFIVDTFIAPSKALGILTRQDVDVPKSIGLQPATREYADLSRWSQQSDEASISTVAEGLLSGKYDSGIVALDLMERYPGRFKLDHVIGPIQDVWVLFGREAVTTDDILLWPESPVRRLLT